MPLYEYVCKDCGSHFDVLRPMKDADSVTVCKQCHGENTHRAISVFFAKNSQGAVAGTSGGCAGCGGGSCASCNHN